MSIKLLIADGQEVARRGLRDFLVGTDVTVVAETSTGKETVELASSHRPDVVLMAVEMAGEDGFSALGRIKRKRPELPVIITANQDCPAYLARAHSLGASGCLTKDLSREDLLAAVRTAAAGGQLWTRADKRRVTGVLTTPGLEFNIEAPLTPREVEVLRAMTEGMTNLEIADRLGVSSETVKEHVQHILRRLGVSDRTQAAVWAVRSGLA